MLYVTPGKFRVSGSGVDLTGISDLELRSILDTAGDMANEYCTVPWGHDFRGGTVVDELGTWDMGGHFLPGTRQVYMLHKPVISVESLRIEVTPTQYIPFETSELYVSPDRAEVTSMALTSYGLFGAAIIPNIGLQKPQYRVAYTYGHRFPVSRERLELDAGKMFRAQNQWWDEDEDVEVEIDGAVATETTDYTVDYDEGTVTVVGAISPTTRVRASYVHKLPSPISKAVNIIATSELGERNLTRKGLAGLIELVVGPVRIRRDFPRAGVASSTGVPDRAKLQLDPFRFISLRGT